MPHAKRREWTIADFLAWEEQQPERWELIGGQPARMMAGGTLANARIAKNIFRSLDRQLQRGPCEAFIENVKVTTPRRVFYPDVFVRCGRFDPKATMIDDPVVVVEVLSPSTENIDWGEKRREYMATTSARHYLIVSPSERLVTHWRWSGGRWVEEVAAESGAVLSLDAVGATLTLDEVFAGIEDPDAAAE